MSHYVSSNFNSIIEKYNASTDDRERGEIYIESIEPEFRKIIERTLSLCIVKKLQPAGEALKELLADTMCHMITRIPKFNSIVKSDGTVLSAFAYFSTITKCYLFGKFIKHEKEKNINVSV